MINGRRWPACSNNFSSKNQRRFKQLKKKKTTTSAHLSKYNLLGTGHFRSQKRVKITHSFGCFGHGPDLLFQITLENKRENWKIKISRLSLWGAGNATGCAQTRMIMQLSDRPCSSASRQLPYETYAQSHTREIQNSFNLATRLFSHPSATIRQPCGVH